MPTFADITTRLNIVGFGVVGDPSYNQILSILESAYNVVTKDDNGDPDQNGIKENWDLWYRDTTNTLTISYTVGQNRYIESQSKIELDPTLAASYVYLTPTGRAVADSLSEVLIHELGHAVAGAVDSDASISLIGQNTKFTNKVLAGLGIPKVAHYWATSNATLLDVGLEYTGGQEVDIAIVLDLSTKVRLYETYGWENYVDTSANGGKKDLLIGDVFDNTLISGAGRDFLYGGFGNDTLVGDGASISATGAVTGITADGISDFLSGGDGADKYYVSVAVPSSGSLAVSGNEIEIGAIVDKIDSYEKNIDKIYYGPGLTELGSFNLRADTSSFYGDYLDSTDENLRFGGKIVGNEIIFGIFDASGFESFAFFKTDLAAISNGKFSGLRFSGSLNQIPGNASGNTLAGTVNDDYITGLGGADIMNGNGGDDMIDGGDGNDLANGNDGNDDLLGELGDDQLSGDAGDDIINGGEGADTLNGGTGNDIMIGGNGGDTYYVDSVCDIIRNEYSGNTGTGSSIAAVPVRAFIVDSTTDVITEAAGTNTGRRRLHLLRHWQ
jgi:Ca2+-binding RTX toxin-like protein